MFNFDLSLETRNTINLIHLYRKMDNDIQQIWKSLKKIENNSHSKQFIVWIVILKNENKIKQKKKKICKKTASLEGRTNQATFMYKKTDYIGRQIK